MSKSKKTVFLIMIVALSVAVSGCLQVEMGLKINEDNSGQMNVLSAFNVDIMGEEMEETPFEAEEIIEAGFDYEEKAVEYMYNDMKFKGSEVSVFFDDFDEFIKSGTLSDDGDNVISTLPNGNKQLKLEFEQDESLEQGTPEEDEEMMETLMALGLRYNFSVDIPFEVVNHNATSVEGTKYVWNLLDQMAKEETFYLILEYKDGSPPVEEPEGDDIPFGQLVAKEKRAKVEEKIEGAKKDKDFHGNVLKNLGIMKGTNNGLELDKGLTRAEGAVMYARLLGLEEDIANFSMENPSYDAGFKDVPQWVKPTVNYLYAKGLIKGMSEDNYGSQEMMTENQYSTLVMRALGYEDDVDFEWSTANVTIVQTGMFELDDVEPEEMLGKNFNRRSMAYISYNALFAEKKTDGTMLIDQLIEE